MPLRLLLLLVLLCPGRSLQLWETREDEAKEAPGHLLARGRRQVAEDEDDYEYHGTDLPEVLGYSPGAVTRSPELRTVTGTSGQRDSAGPGTPEPATLEGTTGASATEGAATGNLSTELATQGIPMTPDPLTKEPVTATPPNTEAPSTEGAPSTELATMKALSMGSEVPEALTTQPAATEALSVNSTGTEALSTGPAATEALTTQPAATEVLSMKSTVMESLPTRPAVIEALSTEPTTTETPSKDPTTMEAISTWPATTRGLTTALVPSDPYRGTTVAISKPSDALVKEGKSRKDLLPRGPVSPRPTEGPDYIPVKHCLLAIFILALVATTFLVCTVVLAVRLSRKNHTYPVRSYSPTEMVCISALLSEREEGPAATANGSLPTKSPGPKAGPQKDRDGDDLTLHSFLP